MTSQPSPAQFTENLTPESMSANAFKLLRSDWMDAFSELESAVRTVHRKHCSTTDTKPLSACLQDLKAPVANGQNQGQPIKGMVRIVDNCRLLVELRVSLVHGVMEIGQLRGHPAAFFHNAANRSRDLPVYLILSESHLKHSCNRLKQLTRQLHDAVAPKPNEPMAKDIDATPL